MSRETKKRVPESALIRIRRTFSRLDYDFTELLSHYKEERASVSKGGDPLATRAGRALLVATIYEYARECNRCRRLARRWVHYEKLLGAEFGDGWEARELEATAKYLAEHPSGATAEGHAAPIHDSEMSPVRSKRDRAYFDLQKIGKRMGAGPFLLSLMVRGLAKDVSWLAIPHAERLALLEEMSQWEQDDLPQWRPVTSYQSINAPLLPGERADLPWGVGIFTGQGLIDGDGERKLWRDELGVEEIGLRIEWWRTDKEILDAATESLARVLEKGRPEEWKAHGLNPSAKAMNEGPKNALIALAARRFNAGLQRGEQLEKERFFRIYAAERELADDLSDAFSDELRKAKLRIKAWGLDS